MYHFLSRAVKKRLVEELKLCFDSNPRHRDIIKHIQEKYDFSERPQKGIVLESASATPQSLSANNFMGTLHSHIMLAHVDNHGGTALDWIREDARAVEANGGYFPSEPGVYYIEIEDITVAGDIPDFQFWVDPLLTVYEEQIIKFVTGDEEQAILSNAPVLEGTVDLYAHPSFPLISGTSIRLEAEESLYVGGGSLTLGFGEGYVPVVATSDFPDPYDFDSTNNVLAFELNGEPISVTFDENIGVSSSVVVGDIQAAIQAAGISYDEYEVEETGDGNVRITASRSLRFEDDLVSTANLDLGFTSGYVAVVATGIIVQPHVPVNSTFRAVVDGVELEIPLYPGNREVGEIADEVTEAFSTTSLIATTVPGGDYTLDPVTGTVTFLTTFEPGTVIVADYKYPTASRGPYRIGGGEVSNNEAIPGVVLAFGNQLEDADVVAVVVEPKRSAVADVYGGKMDMSVDFTIIARDTMTRNELADLTLMYLWQWRREKLAEEGISIENASFSGESEEPYDDIGDDYYYLASISVSLLTDWELYVEKPLFIRRVTTSSFDQDARRAAERNGILLEDSDLLTISPENGLEEFSRIYVVDQKGSYERVR